MRFLLALMFASGVGLVWFGAVVGVQPSLPAGRFMSVRVLLKEAELGVSPYAFTAVVVGCGVAAGLVVWWIVALPAAAFAGVLAGGIAPVAWVRSRREQRRRERERAWPAVLLQLADALEAGL